MTIQIKLYGDLKTKAKQQGDNEGAPSVLNIDNEGLGTVFDILKKFDVEETELSHIFVNGKYCGPGKEIKNGDQVGLFPRKMGLTFLEIAKNNTINVKVKLFAELQKYGPVTSEIDLPEGSTIKSVLIKYRIPKEETNLIIMVNGMPHQKSNRVLNDGDILAIFPIIAGG